MKILCPDSMLRLAGVSRPRRALRPLPLSWNQTGIYQSSVFNTFNVRTGWAAIQNWNGTGVKLTAKTPMQIHPRTFRRGSSGKSSSRDGG